MTKHYNSGVSLGEKILNGVNILTDNVASTLGPRGRNVILQTTGDTPVITKDGVTVAQFLLKMPQLRLLNRQPPKLI